MKQELNLTQLSKSQMEDVQGGGSPDQPIGCSGCFDYVTYFLLDMAQNCYCGSVFNYFSVEL